VKCQEERKNDAKPTKADLLALLERVLKKDTQGTGGRGLEHRVTL